MTDTSKLIERLREMARKRSREHATTLPDDFNEWVAADQIEADRAALEARDAKIADLEARLRLAEKRADDAEARNDFLMTELDKLIEKAKQS